MKIKNKKLLTIFMMFGIVSASYAYVNAEENMNNTSTTSTVSQEPDNSYYNSFVEKFSTYENPYKIIDEDFKNGVINKATWQKSWDYIRANTSKPKEDKQENKEKSINLKGKIDGYKVILTWDKYSGDKEILGYRISFYSPAGEQKTISVEASKNQIENWDAKAGVNKYILYVVGENGDLAESNSVVLSMGPNGGYDFSNGESKKDDNKKGDEKKGETKNEGKKENKGEIKENRDEIKGNIGEFRKDNGFLEQYLTGYELSVRKQILDLKKEYQDRVFEIVKSTQGALTDEQKAKVDSLNTEFMSKVKPLVGDNEKVLEFLKLRYDVFKENQDLRDVNKEMRQDFKDKFGQTNSGANLDQNKNINQDKGSQTLKDKYKKLLQKTIEEKIANLSSERINLIITKIDTLIEKYKSSEDLSQDKKVKFVSQLQAIRDILSDRLLETEDTINLDELFQE